MSRRRRIAITVAAFVGTFLVVGLVAYQLLGVNTWYVPSNSMAPTIEKQSRIATFTLGDTERGDIVLLNITASISPDS